MGLEGDPEHRCVHLFRVLPSKLECAQFISDDPANTAQSEEE